MDAVVSVVICLAVGYIFGCFSTAYFVGKAHGIDIRKEGSGNLGSTNALRTLGVKAGLMTFVGDFSKAVIPIFVLRYAIYTSAPEYGMLMAMWIGLGVVLGHNFPCWLHFKGGKGIAVTAGVILAIADWPVIVCGLLIFVIIVFLTRYVSLGSLIVAFYLPVNMFLYQRENPFFTYMLVVSLIFTALAFFQHRSNIVRLLHGEERKVGEKKQ